MMSSGENMEVYIPRGASITTVLIRALPRSISRKIPASRLHGDQPAVLVTPVELRGIGTTQDPPQLPPGPARLTVVTSNLAAHELIRRCVQSGEVHFSEPRADVVCKGRSSIIAYAGQLFLSVRKKNARDWPPHPPSSSLPEAPPPDSPENLGGAADDVIDIKAVGGGAKHHGTFTEDVQTMANNEGMASRDASTNTKRVAQIKQELEQEAQLAGGDAAEGANSAQAKAFSGASDASQVTDDSKRGERSGEVANAMEILGGKNVTKSAKSNVSDAKSFANLKLADGNFDNETSIVVSTAEPSANAKCSETESQSGNKRHKDAANIVELAAKNRDSATSRTVNPTGKTTSPAVSMDPVVVLTDVANLGGGPAGDVNSSGTKTSRKRLSFGNAEEKLNSERGATLITKKPGAKATSSDIDVVEIDDDWDVAASKNTQSRELAEKSVAAETSDVIIIDDNESTEANHAEDDADVEIVELAERKTESRSKCRGNETSANVSAKKRKISNSGAKSERSAKSHISEVESLTAKRLKQNDADPQSYSCSAKASKTSDGSARESDLAAAQVSAEDLVLDLSFLRHMCGTNQVVATVGLSANAAAEANEAGLAADAAHAESSLDEKPAGLKDAELRSAVASPSKSAADAMDVDTANADTLAKTAVSQRLAGDNQDRSAADQRDVQQGACVHPEATPTRLGGAELRREERITLLRQRLRGMENKLNHTINKPR